MAFNFTLSIFPAIIFLFTLLPYIPLPHLNDNIMKSLAEVMPQSMFTVAASTIKDIINIPRGGLLSFGFLFTMITACNGMMAMTGAFNRCYKTKDTRGFIRKFLTAFSLVSFITLVIVVSISIAVIVKVFLDILEQKELLNKEFLYYLIITLKYLVLSLVFFLGISMIYYVGPAVTVRWNFFSAGNIIATFLSVLFTICFSFYIDSFGTYNRLYGSIGAFIGLMLWFFAISLVLLIGFEINASIDLAKREEEIKS